MFDKRVKKAAKFGYIPETVMKDIIDIKPVGLNDGRMSTRVTLDRVITEEERTALDNVAIIGKDCVAVHRYAPEIKKSYFYVV